MSRARRKPDFCLCENKVADHIRGDSEAEQHLVFSTRIVQFLFLFNLKFQDSDTFLWLYRPVYVAPGRNPEDQFSHVVAQMILTW